MTEPDMEWQPIKTAPRDETAILLYCPFDWSSPEHSLQAVAYFDERTQSFLYTLPGNYIQGIDSSCEPTHWMPLPLPPK